VLLLLFLVLPTQLESSVHRCRTAAAAAAAAAADGYAGIAAACDGLIQPAAAACLKTYSIGTKLVCALHVFQNRQSPSAAVAAAAVT
jgi:hypothetical protein